MEAAGVLMIGKRQMVLDRGYVRLLSVMGDDLSVVNAARVSFDKESKVMAPSDERLLRFLSREGHASPFRHAMMSFEVYAPLVVARQWWKYVVGSDHIMDAWNESSRRYITENNEYYVPAPDEWRHAPADKKQGSADFVDISVGTKLTAMLIEQCDNGQRIYDQLIAMGIAPEQARLFLPAYALYVRWRWTASLQSVLHFLDERLDPHAQWEIRQYANAVLTITDYMFPVATEAWQEVRRAQ